jgi:superfamily II DNA or RNA helicase|tara:strand:- start:825 stop:2864 length:2040 start_codon:yes stop_codon:yes gene_type:complete
MVKQVRFKDLSKDNKRTVREAVCTFSTHVCCVNSETGHGIMKLRDENGRRRALYAHQVIATQRLVRQHTLKPWAQRKVSMLAIHEVGSGKTITAILAIAAIRVLNPHRNDTRTLIIVPTSVLNIWYETLKAWTNLGERILMASKQCMLTDESIFAASVIVTTPGALVAAFKSYAYAGKEPDDLKKSCMQRFKHGVDPKDTARLQELKGALPPVHPLFKLLTHQAPQFNLTIVDEIHRVSNPTSLAGHVVAMFTKVSVYKLGLTGTPVTSKPSQIAHLAKALDAQPEWLQKQQYFFVAKDGADRSLRRPAVAAFHEHLVDRVDASFLDLPDRKCVLLEYDPFVGLRVDGTTDGESIADHNEALRAAQKLVVNAKGGATSLSMDEAVEGAQFGEEQRAAFSAIVKLGNFEFSHVLGKSGANAFTNNPTLFDEAAANPSQTMKLIMRVISSRQEAGHARIAVFCESTTQLRILQRYLENKPVGELFLFDGKLSPTKRGAIIKLFLRCAAGVLLLSGAGSVGVTLCPGCEVLLSVGSLPWNAATIDQAFGRVYRIGQTKPVEIIQFAARRSVTSAKLRLHDDKRDRLSKAAADENFSHFIDGDTTWRQTERILSVCVPLDKCGNYLVAQEQLSKVIAYQSLIEACDAAGVKPPPVPLDLPQPPTLADNIVLPVVSFSRRSNEG